MDVAAPRIAELRSQARQRWVAFAPRERAGLAAGGVLVALALVWLVAVQPAWRTLREAPAEADVLEVQWQQMQRLAAESRELRAAVPVSAAQSAEALRAATERLGTQGRLAVAGDRATLTLAGASGAQLAGWLAEARSAARARVVEATLTRGPQGYSGSVVVALGGAA
ncbi:MAG TPA: type II secretion system protein GspM [Ideonella sp.]|nr:type II secretion system protein GspM [Ideonella sp.]